MMIFENFEIIIELKEIICNFIFRADPKYLQGLQRKRPYWPSQISFRAEPKYFQGNKECFISKVI